MSAKFLKAILVFFVFVFWHCKGCKEKNCGDGYELINDVCQCPPGKFETDGVCRVLKPNEYYGISTDCNCMDSAFFLVGDKEYDANTGKTIVKIHQSHGLTVDPNMFDWPFYFYSTSTGGYLEGAFSIPGCPIDGVPTMTANSFAYYIGADTLKLVIINETPSLSPKRDTCTWYLHK